MRASVRACPLNSLVVYFNVKSHHIWEGNVTIRGDILNKQHPFPRVSGYMRRSDIKGWGEPTRTLVPWRQGFRHPTRNECMRWFAQIDIKEVDFTKFKVYFTQQSRLCPIMSKQPIELSIIKIELFVLDMNALCSSKII